MAARPRDKRRKNWPAHLHAKDRNGLYYFWRHPGTGQEFGLGRDFIAASIQAVEANLKIGGMSADRRLVDKISDDGGGTVAEFLPVYRSIVVSRGAKENTIKVLDSNLRKISAAIGGMIMRRVTTQDLNDKITQPLSDAGKNQAATQVKSALDGLWKEAAGRGKVDTSPVDALRVAPAKVKRARLSLEQFKVIYAAAEAMADPWVANTMRLAIVTAQARECLVAFEFSDVRDGYLWVERGKTGARVKLPVSLTVPGLGWTLEDSIKQCRDRVISRYMLHHTIRRAKTNPGDPVFKDGATRGFSRARDAAGIKWPDGKKPPTLHEIRSLAIRLYSDAYGDKFGQSIAAHKQGSTTDIYRDVRGSEWIEVRAEKSGH